MSFDHESVVGFSKSFGLIYLVVLSLACLVWTYWPSNKQGFDEAAGMPVREEEDRPWR